jgi:hypothetical protein
MSRLKGVDLGIPAGTMNYRGAWTSINTYMANDVVKRSLGLYRALTSVGTNQDPAAAFVPSFTEQAGTALPDTAYGHQGAYTQAEQFTLTSPVTIDSFKVGFGGGQGSNGDVKAGIATSIGTVESAITFLSVGGVEVSGTIPIASQIAQAEAIVVLPSVVTIPAGTYYLVLKGVNGGGAFCGAIIAAANAAPLTGISALSGLSYATAAGGAYTTVASVTPFQLGSGQLAYWEKVADLGVTVPVGTMNYRGAWSSAVAYQPNDVVTRSLALYTALLASTNSDPATPPGAPTVSGTAGGTNAGQYGANSFYQAFTVSSPVTVTALDVVFGSYGFVGHFTVGIASSVGASPSAVSFLTSTAASNDLSTANTKTYAVASVTLQPGTTYYFAGVSTDSGGAYGADGAAFSQAQVISGSLATVDNTIHTANGVTTTAWSNTANGYSLLWALRTTITNWNKIADDGIVVPAGTMNYRGSWSSVVPYQLNDVVSRALALYVALAASTGNDPASAVAATVGTGGNGTGANRFNSASAQAFTVNQTVVVTAIEVEGWTGGSALAAGVTVGIANDFATNGTPTYLGSGVTAASAAGVYQQVLLNTPVTLVPGTTYRLMAPANANYVSTNAPTGVVATLGNAYADAGYANAYPGIFVSFKLDGNNQWTKIANASRQETVNAVAAATGAVTLPDVDIDTIHRLVLTGNVTLTFPPVSAGKSFTLALVQDATGSRTVTWPTSVQWAGGIVPSLTTTPAKKDVISFLCDDGINWTGFVSGQNY